MAAVMCLARSNVCEAIIPEAAVKAARTSPNAIMNIPSRRLSGLVPRSSTASGVWLPLYATTVTFETAGSRESLSSAS
jgi:hypothetical protein